MDVFRCFFKSKSYKQVLLLGNNIYLVGEPFDDPCFYWKRPGFGGAKAKNRGHSQVPGNWYILVSHDWVLSQMPPWTTTKWDATPSPRNKDGNEGILNDRSAFIRDEMKERALTSFLAKVTLRKVVTIFMILKKEPLVFHLEEEGKNGRLHPKPPHPRNGYIAACSGSPFLFNKPIVSLWFYNMLSVDQKTFQLRRGLQCCE